MTSIQVRLPPDVVARLDDLVPYVGTDPGVRRTGFTPNRSTALRVALEIGVQTLEERRAAGLPPVPTP